MINIWIAPHFAAYALSVDALRALLIEGVRPFFAWVARVFLAAIVLVRAVTFPWVLAFAL